MKVEIVIEKQAKTNTHSGLMALIFLDCSTEADAAAEQGPSCRRGTRSAEHFRR